MSKYSVEFKLEVVKYCIEGYHSDISASQHFNIPSKALVNRWVRKYKEHGINGLIHKLKSSYSGDFKQNVIEYMHSNHLSLTETAIYFNIENKDVVKKWERIYYEEGPQGLYVERRGRSKNMSSKSKKELDKKVEEDLIAENQRLRMENEYLKKLNALVQERIKHENKKK